MMVTCTFFKGRCVSARVTVPEIDVAFVAGAAGAFSWPVLTTQQRITNAAIDLKRIGTPSGTSINNARLIRENHNQSRCSGMPSWFCALSDKEDWRALRGHDYTAKIARTP